MSSTSKSHEGALNEFGGHFDYENNAFHIHDYDKFRKELIRRKIEFDDNKFEKLIEKENRKKEEELEFYIEKFIEEEINCAKDE
jgi:hypothetical protein